MKLIMILVFILSNQIATANTTASSECSQVVASLSRLKHTRKKLGNNVVRTMILASLPIAVPLTIPLWAVVGIIAKIYVETRELPTFQEKRFERLKKRILKRVVLDRELARLRTHWGLSTKSVVQLTMKKYHSPIAIHENLLSMSEEMGFTKEEIGRIAQSARDFIMLDVDLRRLLEQGFTRDQIIQIVELGIIAEYRDRLFKGETNSVRDKKAILRQAGFTEEEINRIPAEIFKKDKTRILLNYLDLVIPSATLAVLSDILYWWITGNSFISDYYERVL